MDDDVRAFGMDLGRRAPAQEWPGMHALLAPWLRATMSVDDVRRYWLKVQLQCSDEPMERLGFDYFSEVWAAVVDAPEGLRVG